ncbi:MAG: CPBP family intramembrane metalloprotease [Muribaculaceae bacterium]|nr:CPBP family intramembrane metalloprotease [Muribaculaceae bacterium]
MFTFPKNLMSQKTPLAIALLFCLMVLLLVVTGLIITFLGDKFSNPVAALRICTVIQDILIFFTPAVAVAMISTRYPATLLAVDKLPDLRMTLLAVLALLFSIPFMNHIVEWNKHLTLPESLSSVEQMMRQMEEAAESQIKLLMGGKSVGNLIVNILIIGIMAGFSEEIFFRGALQRLMTVGGKAPHLMIWIAAFVFSAFHLQFFGFFPRLLLGAFFGYLLWWSGSLWLPVLLHSLNNSIVVIAEWRNTSGDEVADINRIGVDSASASDITLVAVSIVMTAALLFMISRRSRQIS